MAGEITEVVVHQDGLGQVGGGWSVGVLSVEPEVPRLLLSVGRDDDAGAGEVWVGLGDTFALGDQTWRFEDIAFRGTPDHFFATLRHVAADAPPFTPPVLTPNERVWRPVEVRHHGTVDETQIARLESDIGRRLPPRYRQWLADTNGFTPAVMCRVVGSRVLLGPLHPTLGIRPDERYLDLRYGALLGEGIFTEDFLVIANTGNGCLAVRTNPPERDVIVGLDYRTAAHRTAYRLAGYASPEEYVAAELVVRLAPDITALEAYLQPVTPGG